MSVLFDASAILALLQNERGKHEVLENLGDSCLSVVTVAEIVTKLSERGASRDSAARSIDVLGCRILLFDINLAIDAGALRSVTKSAGLSLGDRVCIETARRHALPVLTADRAWAGLDLGVDIRLIR
jgi:ribonuclease VapC